MARLHRTPPSWARSWVGADRRDPTRGDSEPGRCWTFTNIGEATPDVLSPMCWNVWTPSGELASRMAWHELGLLPRSEVRLPGDVNQFVMAPFFGRMAINVDRLRTLMGGLPGTSPEDVDRQFLGMARADAPPVSRQWARVPIMAVKAPFVIATQTTAVRRLYAEQHRWWQHDVFGGAGTGSAGTMLIEAADRFTAAMHLHARSRFLSQAFQSKIAALAEQAGLTELTPSLYAGFGEVTETETAEDLWAMSRGDLDETTFLSRHGFHGLDEGHVTGVPWRIDPAPVRALVKTMATRPDSEEPRRRERAAMQQRLGASATLRAALPRSQRPTARLLLRLAGTQVRNQELTKAAFSMALDGARAATAARGEELAAGGWLDDPADAAFLTIPELVDGSPAEARELSAFRRARRDEYRTLILPMTFTGMPEPLTAPDPIDTPSGSLRGAAGSAGIAEGPARVALTVTEAAALEPGEILVCRTTDPSWVGAMVIARALVIDIGAPASHGAIIARELGVPCVIGTAEGTTRLRTGDRIRVDGNTGTVDVVASADRPDE